MCEQDKDRDKLKGPDKDKRTSEKRHRRHSGSKGHENGKDNCSSLRPSRGTLTRTNARPKRPHLYPKHSAFIQPLPPSHTHTQGRIREPHRLTQRLKDRRVATAPPPKPNNKLTGLHSTGNLHS